MCNYVNVNVTGMVSTSDEVEGRINVTMTDDIGTPPLHWSVTPCDRARLAETLTAAIDLFLAEDFSTEKPAEPPAPAPPPPEADATSRSRRSADNERRAHR